MDRITDADWCGAYNCGVYSLCRKRECPAHMAWERLREYEDSRLTPDECKAFGNAEREGRYIVLKEPMRAGVTWLTELAQAAIEGRVQILPKEDANAAHNV